MTLPVLDAALSRVRFDGRVPTLELRNAQPFTGSEDEIFAGIRELVSFLPSNNEDEAAEDCVAVIKAFTAYNVISIMI